VGALRDAFDESRLPFSVDLIEWATSSAAFRRIIDAQSQPLCSARPDAAASS